MQLDWPILGMVQSSVMGIKDRKRWQASQHASIEQRMCEAEA